MSKGQRQTPRKPATKFMHLRKKMQQQAGQQKAEAGKVASKVWAKPAGKAGGRNP
ncbi:MAG: hypothetical protein GTO53_09215 [Planctomycetales bacterium]|nr:hypothetical protein [Planctomycetales bacterium]NIM09306.1 hypothetical protein [Planctomycetales bacterium]NIN08774.1 hypothetical protein [Planctomycetales bacterium]NIN77891.1 hypothetical protein [Planctomycetales bacterium]NIO35074.1 hypothetical protein [Planctomycetales bacterium]